MAYSTSSVSNIADLLTFIRNACTANGWTLAGNVLYRGNCYVEIIADGSIGLRIRGGTGIDGSNNLTGACPQYAWIGTIAGVPLAYPLTAEAHINTAPDEVYIVINYSTSYYSLLAWGMSDAPGLTGSGVWFHANRTTNQGTREYHSDPSGIGISINFGTHVDGAPMFSVYDGSEGTNSGGTNNSFVHHDLDGAGWSSGDDVYPSAFRYLAPLSPARAVSIRWSPTSSTFGSCASTSSNQRTRSRSGRIGGGSTHFSERKQRRRTAVPGSHIPERSATPFAIRGRKPWQFWTV